MIGLSTPTREHHDTIAENLERFDVERFDVEWNRGQFVIVDEQGEPVFYADYSWELSDWADRRERETEMV